MHAIEAKNITKAYNNTIALNNCTITVPQNTIFALLGPNGAGKTTFIKLVLDLVSSKRSTILIQGKEHTSIQSRELISYLPENFSFFSYEKVKNCLKFYAQIYGIQDINHNIEKHLKLLNISELSNRKIKTLSKGQLQRVGLASIFITDTPIIMLDEPFSSLDPIAIKELKETLISLKNRGKTIFLNSHILSEVEKIADEIAILNKGECLTQGKMSEIKDKNNSDLETLFYDLIKKEQL